MRTLTAERDRAGDHEPLTRMPFQPNMLSSWMINSEAAAAAAAATTDAETGAALGTTIFDLGARIVAVPAHASIYKYRASSQLEDLPRLCLA